MPEQIGLEGTFFGYDNIFKKGEDLVIFQGEIISHVLNPNNI
jgi:hypothetical protein